MCSCKQLPRPSFFTLPWDSVNVFSISIYLFCALNGEMMSNIIGTFALIIKVLYSYRSVLDYCLVGFWICAEMSGMLR